MFFILAAVYAVMMFVGFLLIKRPAGWVYDPATSHVSRKTILKKPVFWGLRVKKCVRNRGFSRIDL